MNSSIWGPHSWYFLHIVSFHYPINPSKQDKINYKKFYDSIQNILPCKKCNLHYSQLLKKFPIQLNSRLDLIKWLINIHNEVNKSINKKILSFNDIENIYNNQFNYSIKNNESLNNQNLSILLFFILILLLLIYLKY